MSARTSNARRAVEPEVESLAQSPSASPRLEPAAQQFGRLVEQHVDFVWRSLRRLGVHESEADDATQQVFLVANQKFAQIRPGKERSFLIGVAMRVASHAHRAYQRRQAAQERLSERVPEREPDPEHLAQRRQTRERLDRALDELPEHLRIVFVLFELEEMTVDQIAELLEIPRGTAATRLRRSRVVFQKVAQRLKEDVS